MTDNSFFSKSPLSYTGDFTNLDLSNSSVEEKRWAILLYLQRFPKTTKYKVGKVLKIPYASIHQIFRELEFARVICSEKIQTENGEMHDAYYIPDFQSVLSVYNPSKEEPSSSGKNCKEVSKNGE
ncbi:MAG: hypothetical protein NUV46_00615 [Nanoarchaeota archaeon]|nr:hypothetical protein [Nanoarchaeota archaeon]